MRSEWEDWAAWKREDDWGGKADGTLCVLRSGEAAAEG